MVDGVELTYNTSATALQMANAIFGNGVIVTGASYVGAGTSSAIYSNGQLAPGVVPSTTGVILSTGRAADFTNSSGQSNQSGSTSTNTSGPDNVAQFNALVGTNTYDASYLNADFIPTGNLMTIQFVFSSEEYPEYSASVYNDVVGVWINGNHVPLSVSSSPTSVGGVNQNNNINLYHDNTSDQFNTEMDGFTVTMTLTIPVNPGVVNSIRIGIADVADSNYDSNLIIAGDSAQTILVAQDDLVTMRQGTTQVVDVLGNDVNNTIGTLKINQVNGIAVSAGDSVTLATGQVVTLNANGTFSIETDSDIDTISFTYGVQSIAPIAGLVLENDTGFVTVSTIPCFVAGTMILTPDGEVPVETLTPDDLVMTHDHGPQPLRWIGRRRVQASGDLAPIRIRAGTFGDHRTLLVSPQHRVLVRDSLAALLFGENEVLIAAKDLINDRSVVRVEGGVVDYVHLLFDRHQLVFSDGLTTESFLPGPQTTHALEREIVAEICTIFPELDPATGAGYSRAARRTLRRFEAELLFAQGAAA